MTLIEAITRIDTLKPNTYTQQEKIKWLSTLDGIIKNEVIDTHEGSEDIVFNGYDENTGLATVLLVPAPYDDIYIRWLETRIDYTNGEYARYNNGVKAYNDVYDAYRGYYNRTHLPKGKKTWNF
jgi:hypothetical protein